MVCLRVGLSWLIWARLSGKLSWASWGFCRFSGGSCAPCFPHPPWKGRRARAGSFWEGKVSREQAQRCKNILSFCQHPISQTSTICLKVGHKFPFGKDWLLSCTRRITAIIGDRNLALRWSTQWNFTKIAFIFYYSSSYIYFAIIYHP